MRFVRDIPIVFIRYFGIFIKNPIWVFIGVMQPLLYLLLFAPLLKPISEHTPGFPPGGAYNVFVPGLLIQMGLFSASGVGFGLIEELREGVIERFRVTPVSRFALLMGRSLRDIFVLLLQSLILVVVAIPFGLHASALNVALMFCLLALVALTFTSISYAVALWLKDENSYAPLVFTVSLPLLLLSGVLLPLNYAPDWLQKVADVNPLKYAVDASRAIFNNNLSNQSVWQGFLIMGVLATLCVIWGARRFSSAIS